MDTSTMANLSNDNGQDMGDTLAFVAGIMLAVEVCELLLETNLQRKDCGGSDLFGSVVNFLYNSYFIHGFESTNNVVVH